MRRSFAEKLLFNCLVDCDVEKKVWVGDRHGEAQDRDKSVFHRIWIEDRSRLGYTVTVTVSPHVQ